VYGDERGIGCRVTLHFGICLVLDLMTLTESQLTRAIYSLWDFQQALSALTFLLEDCDFDQEHNKVDLRRFRCYETTLIISMTRPFEASRSGTTLNLGITGIRLTPDEGLLVEKVMHLRRKIIAHSDEEEMHYRSIVFPVDDEFNLPHIQFDEGLHLDEPTFRQIELLLRTLEQALTKFLFRLSQDNPDLLQRDKIPNRLKN
jgi:hypothetical protein